MAVGLMPVNRILGPFPFPAFQAAFLTEQAGIALLINSPTNHPAGPSDVASAPLTSWLGKEGTTTFPSADATLALMQYQ